jgi:hypothetical protein
MIEGPPKKEKKQGYQEPQNLIYIINPFDALTIYSALEYVEERKGISRSLKEAIQLFKNQTNSHITDEQINDAKAEFEVRVLLDKY